MAFKKLTVASLVSNMQEYKLPVCLGELDRLVVKRLPGYKAVCVALDVGVFALASAVREGCVFILTRARSIAVLVADGDVAHGLDGRSSELRDTHGVDAGVVGMKVDKIQRLQINAKYIQSINKA